MDYCLPEIPDIYWISSLKYKCKVCGLEFTLLLPKGDDVVKYQEVNGSEIRWLPAYEKGGYLDLMLKLIPGFKKTDEITVKIAREFNDKIREYIEPSINGNSFTLASYKRICIGCKSADLQCIEDNIITSPKVEWLKIACGLVQQQE